MSRRVALVSPRSAFSLAGAAGASSDVPVGLGARIRARSADDHAGLAIEAGPREDAHIDEAPTEPLWRIRRSRRTVPPQRPRAPKGGDQ